jgi:hypothetical protein
MIHKLFLNFKKLKIIFFCRERFKNYPESGVMADKNEKIKSSGTILGMRLKSLNNTNGLWELIGGGLNENFASFNFKGSATGSAYDFTVEVFGNNAKTVKLSIILFFLSFVLIFLNQNR